MLDDLKEVRKAFAKASKSGIGTDNARISVVKENGSVLDLGNGPCHGALQQYQLSHKLGGGKVAYILSWVAPIRTDKAFSIDYFKWLANDSPWASVFVTKDVEDILEFGWVVDANHPHNFVASALIATRNVTERYIDDVVTRVPIYKEILRLGFSHEVAYIFSATFNSGFRKLYPITYMRLSTGHSPFELNDTEENYYRNFLNHTPTNLKDKTFKEYGGYTGDVCAVWSKKTEGRTAFQNWLRGLKPVVAVLTKDHHIFRKTIVDSFLIQTPEDFKNILEQALARINNA